MSASAQRRRCSCVRTLPVRMLYARWEVRYTKHVNEYLYGWYTRSEIPFSLGGGGHTGMICSLR